MSFFVVIAHADTADITLSLFFHVIPRFTVELVPSRQSVGSIDVVDDSLDVIIGSFRYYPISHLFPVKFHGYVIITHIVDEVLHTFYGHITAIVIFAEDEIYN